MGQIQLNFEDALRVLKNDNASPEALVIAGCTIALFVTCEHANVVDCSTRSIALKLSHMVAANIYNAEEAN